MEKPRKYACLMAMLPPLVSKAVQDWVIENIPDFHLAPSGRELRPHVTVKFGLESNPETFEATKDFLRGLPPLRANLAGLGLFESGYGKWRGDSDGSVLYASVESPDLYRLNAAISETFPCHDTFPTYKPHLTLAYLRPEVARSYLKEKPPFLPCTLMLDELEWSGADGELERIPLSVFPAFGTKALEERKDKRGHRYCVETGRGRVPCPPKKGEAKVRVQSRKKPPKILPPEEFDDYEQFEEYLDGLEREHPGIKRQLREQWLIPDPDSPQTEEARKEIRARAAQTLKTAEVKKWDRLLGGINSVFLLDLGDVKGVFKPEGGETVKPGKFRKNITGPMYKREVTAARVAEILGLDDLVPTTVLRDVGGEEGSLQEFVPGAPVAKMFGSKKKKFDGPEDLARAAAFDFVTGACDRHAGNWLVKGDKLVLIDNGACFPETEERLYGKDNYYLMNQALRDELPIPKEARGWANKLPEIKAVLEELGISPKALEVAEKRLALLANPKVKTFADLRDGPRRWR